MENFVYVCDEKTRDQLLSDGYELLGQNNEQHIFVFLNKDILNFEDNDLLFVLSDMLIF